MTRCRLLAPGLLGDERAFGDNLAVELFVFARIDHVDAAPEHGDGPSASAERAQVGRGIHASREAASPACTVVAMLWSMTV